jgi:hypothetical protein
LCIYMWELRFHIHWNKKPNLLLSFQWITVAAMTGSLKSQTTVTCQENVMYIVQSKEDKYLYYGLSLVPWLTWTWKIICGVSSSCHCFLLLPWAPIAVLYHSGDSATLYRCCSCYWAMNWLLSIVFLSFCH